QQGNWWQLSCRFRVMDFRQGFRVPGAGHFPRDERAIFEKFGAGDGVDGETTEPATDRSSQMSSVGSDEESIRSNNRRQAIPPAAPPRYQHSSQPTRRPAEENCRWQEDSSETQGLVEIDPEEGKRRGTELLSQLFDFGQALSAPPAAPALPPAPQRLRPPPEQTAQRQPSYQVPVAATMRPGVEQPQQPQIAH
ncbi:unnamed protein product, partial [Polarella glacialis]